ncbi:MAG: Gfo/Idh/MocA family oxidoreductase, partial [Clostridiales bacterium]|nr:Gfo/Idh/MocA family oxidoreductase [Clostridiales bacterium]
MKIAVIGTGDISGIYLHNMTHVFRNTEVVSCCARHLEHAQAKAEAFGIRAMTLDEILSDSEIELVLVLTGAAEHYSIIRRALLAGKHVYTEKTMTITLEQAKELVALAEEKGLYLGSAPDTFLSPAFQAVKKAIGEGKIGEVTSFQIQATRCIDLLASFALFLREPGGGVCQDYGVYFLTGLVNLLGPVDRVMAVYKNRSTKRINCVPESPDFGKEYEYRNESQVEAIIETK